MEAYTLVWYATASGCDWSGYDIVRVKVSIGLQVK